MGRAAATRPGRKPPSCLGAFEQERDFVVRTLRRYGVTAAEAEDLAQEVFLVMWRRWPEYDQARPLRPWLSGIIFRLVSHHRRRTVREIPSGPLLDAITQADPESDLGAWQARRLVDEAVASLPPRHRSVFVQYELEGRPMSEIARAMSAPLSTVYSRLRTARRSFGKTLRRLQLRSRRALLVVLLAGAAAAAAIALSALRSAAPRPAPHPAAAIDLHRGLIGYWPFDDGPGSAQARDRSGRGGDCVLRGLDPETSWAGGATPGLGFGWGSALCPFEAGAAGDLTVVARVQRLGVHRGYRAIAHRQAGGGRADHFFLGFIGETLVLHSDVWGSEVEAHVALPDERWFHVAAVHDGRTGVDRLYVDGVEVASAPARAAVEVPVDGPLAVGGGINGPDPEVTTQHFHGLIAGLAVYRRPLAPREIEALAAGAHP
jgi:RNA polymerase sigma-70 factor (ECF subfamily)